MCQDVVLGERLCVEYRARVMSTIAITQDKQSVQAFGAGSQCLQLVSCVQVTVESLTVKSVGDTISSGLWGLDRIDQKSDKRDYEYHYSYDGSGVHVYPVDTVRGLPSPAILHASMHLLPVGKLRHVH